MTAEIPPPEDFEPSPEDFLPSPPRIKGPLELWPPRQSLSGPLWFGAMFLALSVLQWSQPQQYPFWVSGDVVWRLHRYGRLLSALFVHGDIVHLASNLPLFLFFAWLLQSFFGRWIFPGVAFLIGVLSNLITLQFYEPDVRMLGASGMVYGMIALWLVYFIYFERNLKLWHRLIRAFGFALMMLIPRSYEPSVSYMSHFSGFTLGLVFGVLTLPFVGISAAIEPLSQNSVA